MKHEIFTILSMFDLGIPDVNKRGNLVYRTFYSTNRYFFDRLLCPANFKQFDTDQDAWYFGVWANKELLCTATYCEGDITVVICLNKDNFNAEIQCYIDSYGEGAICRAYSDDKSEPAVAYRQDRKTFLIS